jgi:amino acid transporter
VRAAYRFSASIQIAQSNFKRLNKLQGLAAFSPDGFASIGYADQEIYLGLMVAGSVGLAFALPIALAIIGLLAVLALSYYQIVQKYPSGGGSYEVARTTLGSIPGLITAAALIVNYLLNVAVSLTTGVDAIASAFNQLWLYRAELSLLLLVAITILSLRGIRESGIVMAIPVYLFLAAYLPMLGLGAIRLSGSYCGPTRSNSVRASASIAWWRNSLPDHSSSHDDPANRRRQHEFRRPATTDERHDKRRFPS